MHSKLGDAYIVTMITTVFIRETSETRNIYRVK